MFFDSEGNIRRRSVQCLMPGHAAFLELTAAEFFTKSGITIGPVPSGTPTKDGRVVFDHFRKRFFMAFQRLRSFSEGEVVSAESERQGNRPGRLE